jgi:hypothetical protein
MGWLYAERQKGFISFSLDIISEHDVLILIPSYRLLYDGIVDLTQYTLAFVAGATPKC